MRIALEQREFHSSYLTEKHNGKSVSYMKYLHNKRIELDTVVKVVRAQRFYGWLQNRILKTFDTRDRVFVVPADVARFYHGRISGDV